MADPLTDPNAPWSWVPSSWTDLLHQPDPALQPGLGVPPSVVDAAMPPIAPPTNAPDPQQLALAGNELPPGSVSPWSMPLPQADQGSSSSPAPAIPMPAAPANDNAAKLPDAISGAGEAAPPVEAVLGETKVDPAVLPPIPAPKSSAYDQAHAIPANEERPDGIGVTQADHDAADLAEQNRVINLTPEQRAIEQINHDTAARQQAQARELEERKKDIDQLKRDVSNRQAADLVAQRQSDQIVADAVRLGNTKIDPERWTNSRSTGQTIMNSIAGILGGLVQDKNGGHNIALDRIDKQIEQDIAAQQADIANGWKAIDIRKGAVGEQFARNANAYQQAETMRLATWEYTKNVLTTEQANYDPKGTKFLQIGNTVADIRARQEAARQAMQKTIFDNHMKELEANDRHDALTESVREHKATEKLTAWGHSLTANAQTETHRHNLVDEEDKKDTRALAREDKATARQDKIDAAKEKEDAKNLELGVGGLTIDQKEGSPLVHAPTKEEGEKLRGQKAGVDAVNELVNKNLRGIEKYGGASKWLDSAEYKRNIANTEGLLLSMHKAYGIEGFRGSVLEIMDKATGEADLNSFFRKAGNIEGLKAAKDNINSSFSHSLRVADPRFKGSYEPEDTSNLATKPSDAHQAYQDTLQDKTPQELAQGQEVGAVRKAGEFVTGGGMIYNNAADRQEISENSGSSQYPGLSKAQGDNVGKLIAAYKTGKDEATRNEAKQSLLDLTGDKKRTTLSTAVLGAIRNDAPDIYSTAVAALPKDRQDEIKSADQIQSAIDRKLNGPTASELVHNMLAGDHNALAELNKRALAGDAEAQNAIAVVKKALGN